VQTVKKALYSVFSQRYAQLLFLPILLLFLAAFIFIPTVAIVGNSLSLQLQLYTVGDYVMLVLLAGLNTLLVFSVVERIKRQKNNVFGTFGSGLFGSVSGVFASVFGAATCPMCVAALFGFLGTAGVGVLVEYRQLIFAGLVGFTLVIVYRQLTNMPAFANE
jgi:hypothetical protein